MTDLERAAEVVDAMGWEIGGDKVFWPETWRRKILDALAAVRRDERDRIREMLLSISAEHDEAGRLRESETLDNAVDRALPLTPEEPT